MTDEAFYAWLKAWRVECDALLAQLDAIFKRAGV